MYPFGAYSSFKINKKGKKSFKKVNICRDVSTLLNSTLNKSNKSVKKNVRNRFFFYLYEQNDSARKTHSINNSQYSISFDSGKCLGLREVLKNNTKIQTKMKNYFKKYFHEWTSLDAHFLFIIFYSSCEIKSQFY